MITCNVKYTITLEMDEFDNLISNIDEILNTFTTGEDYVWGEDEYADAYYRKCIDDLNDFKKDLLSVAIYKINLGKDE